MKGERNVLVWHLENTSFLLSVLLTSDSQGHSVNRDFTPSMTIRFHPPDWFQIESIAFDELDFDDSFGSWDKIAIELKMLN